MVAAPAAVVVLALVALTLLSGSADSRGDRTPRAADGDRDGLPDSWERRYRLSTRAASARQDPDRDRLSNRSEYRARLNPRRSDTDRDGLDDRYEIFASKTNPRRPDTVFVDSDSIGGRCDDSRTAAAARSAATPLCSVGAAARKANAIYLRSVAGPRVRIATTGDRGQTTIRPAPGDRPAPLLDEVRVDGAADVRLEGFRVRRLVVGGDARRISLVRNRITGGILLEPGAQDVEILNNSVSSPRGDGVLFASSYGRAAISSVSIRGNDFQDIGRVGINVRNFRAVSIERNSFQGIESFDGKVHPDVIRTFNGGSGLVIRGNRILDSAAQGIFIKDGPVEGLRIENNLIAGIRGGFWAINLYDVSSARIVGNTVWNNSSGLVFQGRATDVVVANNILQNLKQTGSVSYTYRRHNLIASGDASRPGEVGRDPRFLDAAGGDYRLGPRSPAIDAGTSDWGSARDQAGGSREDDPRVRNRGAGARPFYDLGAYERR